MSHLVDVFGCSLIAAVMVFATWAPPIAVAQSPGGLEGQNLDPPPYLRTPGNDAINCLYLQLRLLGYTGKYAAFRAQFEDEPQSLSLKSLADVGRKLGFRLAPVTTGVSELSKGAPGIVHLEENGIGAGRFVLFLRMDKGETNLALIDGTHVKFVTMPRDEFRRNWTGYALIAQPGIPWRISVRRWTTGLVIAVAAVCLLCGRVGLIARASAPRTNGV
jgi:Peptidase C39 family